MKQPDIVLSAEAAALWSAAAAAFPQAALFIVDGEQTVRAFSAGAEALLGFSAASVVGSHCRKSNRCQSCMTGCGLRDRGVIDGVPLVLYREDGTTVAVRKTARAFASVDGAFVGGIEILVRDDDALSTTTTPSSSSPLPPSLPPSLRLPILDDVIDAPLERAGILTRDPAMRRLLSMVENVARSEVTVLLRGESGTGKELFARLLHEASPRANGAFVAVNCAAITPGLLESELFGHDKGAFTGAVGNHQGFFERANGGTLFLDEVAELPLELQAKLLRVLETRSFFRVGGKRAVDVDVRIVSATHRSLRAEVAADRFREDLLYRLRVVPVFLPPLRERRADIPLLVERFVQRLNAQAATRRGRMVETVAPAAMRALLSWPFAGNVRELRNVVEYAFAVGAGSTIERADLPPEFSTAEHPASTAASTTSSTAGLSEGPVVRRGRPVRVIPDGEQRRLIAALKATGGDVGAAAARLGLSRATFWRRRRDLGL